jgi:hypothetical protein
MVGAEIGAADEERELVISRRNFIWCGTVALLPLPTAFFKTDPYDQFLNAVRERLIALTRDGHVLQPQWSPKTGQ